MEIIIENNIIEINYIKNITEITHSYYEYSFQIQIVDKKNITISRMFEQDYGTVIYEEFEKRYKKGIFWKSKDYDTRLKEYSDKIVTFTITKNKVEGLRNRLIKFVEEHKNDIQRFNFE